MAKRLDNKVAIVFGSTGNVGPTIATRLAEEGARVVVHYNSNKEKADKIVSEIQDNGGKAIALQADANNEEAISSLLKNTVTAFGSIDIAVNVIHKDKGWSPVPVNEMTWDDDWSTHIEAMKTNFIISKNILPYMRKQCFGRIVYISGGLAYRFYKGCSAFSASKAGMNAFCKTLALEEGENNITVNIVAPGKVEPKIPLTCERFDEDNSRKCPLGKFACPEDVANAVLFFASDESSCITGQTMYVSGGEIMPMP